MWELIQMEVETSTSSDVIEDNKNKKSNDS